MDGTRIITVTNISAAYAFTFGAYIAWPYTDMFVTGHSLYAPMSSLVDSEAFWGLLMMACGVLTAMFHGSPTAKRVMWVYFLAFSGLFFIGDFERPGGALFLILALANFFQHKGEQWNNFPRG